MTWFYLTSLAILIGAEFNAEIEHASPYGKSVGEKVPGEKKKIGIGAERDYEERRKRGEAPAPPFPDNANCDLDRPAAHEPEVRASDLIIGTAALLRPRSRSAATSRRRWKRTARRSRPPYFGFHASGRN